MSANETTKTPSQRKRFVGVVTAAKTMAKTVRVDVERFVWHPKVRKQVRRTTRFLVHDEPGSAQVGDRVLVEETRPLSKRKHFRVVRIEQRAAGPSGELNTES